MRATDPATAAVDWEDLTYSWAGSQLILANTQTGTIATPGLGRLPETTDRRILDREGIHCGSMPTSP